MPIYEYECRKCHAVTEKIQGIQDRPLRKCPSCGGRVEKRMSQGSFILKGSGWYATDYGSKANGVGKGAKKAPACPATGKSASPACAGCPNTKTE